MTRQVPSPEARLLSARVRTGDKRAIQRVLSELRRNDGNVQAAAKALGVTSKTLYQWRAHVEELAAGFEEHARGRIGRPPTEKP